MDAMPLGAILMDPTSGCNLQCTGCWAAEYVQKMNMSFETLDDIIQQGKKLGIYFYLYSSGEPLVRKKRYYQAVGKTPLSCIFLAFTNGTLLTNLLQMTCSGLKNFVPAISIEGGMKILTDSRRGKGTYQRVIRAMKILKDKKLAFGISCCYTRENVESVGRRDFR